jgi:hypothetical protein
MTLRDLSKSPTTGEYHLHHQQRTLPQQMCKTDRGFCASSQRSLQACSAQGVGRVIYLRLIFEGESLDIVRQREAGIDLENLCSCNT